MLPLAVSRALLSRRNVLSVTMLGTNVAVILIFFAKVIVSDNLALLLGTLRTYQRTGCDRDIVTLKCPHGTTISVQLANYGKVAADERVCPAATTTTSPNHNNTCRLPPAVQIVVEACQKKRQCKFHASPKTAISDLCPGVSKHVEVTYKCRPYEFRSKVACENEVVQLTCNPNSRLAVYSASFGRTEYESVQCPQPQGVPEETCLVSYATETVMHICHGKRRCTIGADMSTFGNPCRPTSRMYLKIVYTCVPRKVVLIEQPTLDDESTVGASRDAADYDDLEGYDMDDIFRESAFSPKPGVEKGLVVNMTHTTPATPLAKDQTAVLGIKKIYTLKKVVGQSRSSAAPVPAVQQDSNLQPAADGDINCTFTFYSTAKPRLIGFLSEWINTYSFLKKNQEKMYLYLIVSITSGLLVFLIIVIARLMVQKYRTVREVKMYSTHHDHTIPHEFGDESSEIDADITLATTPTAVPHISTLGGSTYRSGSGPPRPDPLHQSAIDIVPFREIHDSAHVEAPRSLSRYGNSQYYFG